MTEKGVARNREISFIRSRVTTGCLAEAILPFLRSKHVKVLAVEADFLRPACCRLVISSGETNDPGVQVNKISARFFFLSFGEERNSIVSRTIGEGDSPGIEAEGKFGFATRIVRSAIIVRRRGSIPLPSMDVDRPSIRGASIHLPYSLRKPLESNDNGLSVNQFDVRREKSPVKIEPVSVPRT